MAGLAGVTRQQPRRAAVDCRCLGGVHNRKQGCQQLLGRAGGPQCSSCGLNAPHRRRKGPAILLYRSLKRVPDRPFVPHAES